MKGVPFLSKMVCKYMYVYNYMYVKEKGLDNGT